MQQQKKFNPYEYIINDKLNLREYQLKNLEIISYFDKFCRKHKLVYYICGGACIGSIRHKGFIPWDCDIDVFMPRKDYEKLGYVWKKYADTEHYAYDRTTRKNNMHAQCIGIKDNYTTYIRNHNVDDDMNHGIMLDVIPLDALSDNWFKWQIQKLNGLIFCLFNAQRLPNQQGKLIRIISGVILALFWSKELRYRIWKKAEKEFSKYNIEECKYWGELTTGFHNINLRFPKSWFAKPSEMEFEGKYFCGPTKPEEYLESRYPGYMNYPPQNEQVPKLQCAFIDINTPYKEYKGIKYCVNN